MRKIERTSQFQARLQARGQRPAPGVTRRQLGPILVALVDDQLLESQHHDHALSGGWKDHRDCHVKPDLVLIYQKPAADTLRLVRLG